MQNEWKRQRYFGDIADTQGRDRFVFDDDYDSPAKEASGLMGLRRVMVETCYDNPIIIVIVTMVVRIGIMVITIIVLIRSFF